LKRLHFIHHPRHLSLLFSLSQKEVERGPCPLPVLSSLSQREAGRDFGLVGSIVRQDVENLLSHAELAGSAEGSSIKIAGRTVL
jgi:hypothetical protein